MAVEDIVKGAAPFAALVEQLNRLIEAEGLQLDTGNILCRHSFSLE
jgi:hypothetical protein